MLAGALVTLLASAPRGVALEAHVVRAVAAHAAECVHEADSIQEGASLHVRVNRAIARGVAWLAKEQQAAGHWNGQEEPHPGGVTALAAYTLLKSGLPRDERPLSDALAALRGITWKSTYSAAVYLMLQAALLERSKTAVADPAARQAFDLIVATQKEGLWAYPSGGIDMSNTQFALLGLRAGRELGFEVPERLLEKSVSALFQWQTEGGGFAYSEGNPATASVTAATLGGFAVLAELGRGNEKVEGVLRKRRAELARAQTWIEARFTPGRNAYDERFWTASHHYAGLWAVERWCGFTGRARIGASEWYPAVAEWLVAAQKADGSFGRDLSETCFALLVLRQATITGSTPLGDVWKALDKAQAPPELVCAAEVPRLVDWLVCGPLRDKDGLPQFVDPSSLRLEKLQARDGTRFASEIFERMSLKKDGWTNLEEELERPSDKSLWVLATTLVVDPVGEAKVPGKEASGATGANGPLEALLWLTFEDGCKVWLDGKLVHESLRMQSAIEEDTRVELALEPGLHRLVVLVPDWFGASAFAARISDRKGKPIPARLRAQAEPPIAPGSKR